MRVVFCSSYYPEYLDFFYRKNPRLVNAPYQEQMNALQTDFCGGWPSFTRNFNEIGADAKLIIPNCKPLQRAWAAENKINFTKDWSFRLPLEQVKKIRPDIFFISSMFDYYSEFLNEIKKMTPNVFGWISCQMPKGVKLGNLDLILTSLPYFVDNFRDQGIPSEFLHAAFDKEILNYIGNDKDPKIDFSFIGSFTGAHKNRINAVKSLLNKTPLVIYGTGIRHLSENRSFYQRLISSEAITKKYKGEVWGVDMFKILKNSKITFNNHIDVSNGYVGNMRMYEATGVGTLLLTDGKDASDRLFADNEVVFYDSPDDAAEKVHYYLNNEKERLEIAAKGQSKTLNNYTYEISARRMYEYLRKYMK